MQDAPRLLVVRLTSCHIVSISCCAPSTSVACSPPSIHTTALPSRASARAVVGQSLGQRQPARDVLVLRQLPVVLRRGDDRHQLTRPSAVRPIALHDHAIASLSSFRTYSVNLV